MGFMYVCCCVSLPISFLGRERSWISAGTGVLHGGSLEVLSTLRTIPAVYNRAIFILLDFRLVLLSPRGGTYEGDLMHVDQYNESPSERRAATNAGPVSLP